MLTTRGRLYTLLGSTARAPAIDQKVRNNSTKVEPAVRSEKEKNVVCARRLESRGALRLERLRLKNQEIEMEYFARLARGCSQVHERPFSPLPLLTRLSLSWPAE